jgi:hypothetical protein
MLSWYDYMPRRHYNRFLEHAVRPGFLTRRGRGYEFFTLWWDCFKAFELDEAGP